jgi:hypothetical protein
MITIKELALKYGMEPRKARKVLRTENAKKVDKYYWVWKPGSKLLNKVEQILFKNCQC